MNASAAMSPRDPTYAFAILGAGAMGTILAAHLIRAGHSVPLPARGRRASQIEAEGLKVTGLAELRCAARGLEDPAALIAANTLIVATKTPGTEEALQRLQHARFEVTFSIQNGPLKDELLEHAFGATRVL